MFVDARTLPTDTVIKTDLCIIGAGAAGITIARECIDTGLHVTILESGGADYEQPTQDLYTGENIGHENFPLDVCRLRYLGGSTNHWSGRCRPLDAIDFAVRPWVPHSGWPFERAALDPYYRRAEPVCDMQPFSYELDDAALKSETLQEAEPLALDPDVLATRFYQYSPPTRFGSRYRAVLEKAPNIGVYLYANALDVATTENAAQVTGITAATLAGNRFTVRPRIVIVTTGGIENARLLLSWTETIPTGLGNQNDLVGRYFMEHPLVWSSGGALFGPRGPDYRLYQRNSLGALTYQAYVQPSEALQAREGMLNCGVDFAPVPMHISDNLAFRDFYGQVRQLHWPDNLAADLHVVALDLNERAHHLKARAEGLWSGKPPDPPRNSGLYSVRYWAEGAPNPDSRVTLAETRDALGMCRVNLDWRLTEQDNHTLNRLHETVGLELGRLSVGRLRFGPPDADDPLTSVMGQVEASNHHMGTTRMHDDPTRGVVDADCKLHGTANLYVAGSSVFPTSGQANPTLTIVALALRLADHVKQQMA